MIATYLGSVGQSLERIRCTKAQLESEIAVAQAALSHLPQE